MMTKTSLLPVPYKGGGPIAIDLMAGHVMTSFSTMPPIIPHIRAGRVKALAVTRDKRAAVLPDVPTIAENVPGYAMSTWYGATAPAKTPREIVIRLNQEMVKALAAPEVKERLASLGAGRLAAALTLLWDTRFSLITIVLAGFGRAAAEVGAVMIVGGNIDGVTRVMTTTIALETSKGDLALALGLGIILVTLVLLLNAGAYTLKEAAQRRYG